ncbi:carbohydrate ABC transporter permease [Paenibacillus sp. 481]|uniref:carbohydrate ABC transporter permease n=1 Tax=Paenibacillus sp. 481 TaxID=2835869 RepID=UPI001E2BF42F|nr:sugar ABC transporter permease [Paenibacillus sp. 481]UHA74238.1 sugar ABC transporter permease [Paenibacillus sp. 481]
MNPWFSVKKQKYVFIYSCLLIPLLFFAAIRLLPMLYSFYVGFHEWDLLSSEQTLVGMDNYTALFKDDVFVQSLSNTAVYVLVGVPGQMALGLTIALLLHRIIRWRTLFRTIYFIPFVTSVVAVSWVFRWMLMPNGIVNHMLISIGVDPQLLLGSPTQAIYLVIAAMIWQGIGFQMLIFLTGLQQIPRMYVDAASIDGANAWQRFVHISLPLLRPVLVFSVIIGSIDYLQSFTQVMNMTTGGPLNSTISVVLYIYELAFKQFNLGLASAATVILFGFILLLSLLQLKLLNRKMDY